jgi:hypothetical protein
MTAGRGLQGWVWRVPPLTATTLRHAPNTPPLRRPRTPTLRPHKIFFSVYELAIDTVLLAFCEDSEAHGGHPVAAPPLLMEAIGEPPPREDCVEGWQGAGSGKARR